MDILGEQIVFLPGLAGYIRTNAMAVHAWVDKTYFNNTICVAEVCFFFFITMAIILQPPRLNPRRSSEIQVGNHWIKWE